MDKIAVLIPCYNEAQTIEKVVKEFKRELPEATVYVYDNNSKDGTDDIARAAGAVVRYEHQQGKGNVVRRMFQEIEAECYLMVDGDDTYPAENARALVKQPEIILADEPTGNLNYAIGRTITEALLEAGRGKTLICVTHDERLCELFDVVINMNEVTASAAKGGEQDA